MPRLTNRDYLTQRQLLIKLWAVNDASAFAVLPGYAQRDLHDFYAPTISMTDEYALEYRAQMTKAFPALPQSAGRAIEALRANLEGRDNEMVSRHLAQTTGVIKVGGKTRRLRVLAVSRPEIDTHYLAQALLRISREDDGTLLKEAVKAKRRNDRKRSSR